MNYQQIVIGTGRDAIQAAIAAAQNFQRVALIETADRLSGRVTGQVLRRAAERLIKAGGISMATLRREVHLDLQTEHEAERAELAQRNVDLYSGTAQLLDARTVTVDGDRTLTGDSIVLACGTKSAPLGRTPFDDQTVLATENLLSLDKLPETMVVIGAGRTGLDHAIVLALLGVQVTVVDNHSSMFDLCGGLMGGAFFEAQSLDIAFRLSDEAIGIERRLSQSNIAVRLASGKAIVAKAALVCVGRAGRTDGMNLEDAGVGLDEHGRVWCDASGRTWAPSITAIGDVVGFRPNMMAG